MFPSLHQDVMNAVSDRISSMSFAEEDTDMNCEQDYQTHVRARFACTNKFCSQSSWASGNVAILIRQYAEHSYNAVVFNQRCQSCNRLGNFFLDKASYVERVAYRLNKWAGVEVERPPYTRKKGKPHKRDLCEGCRRGFCLETDE